MKRLCVSLYEYGDTLNFYKEPIEEIIEWSKVISEHQKARIEAIKKARRK